MLVAVLCSPESWYLRDLQRTAGDRHEVVPLTFRHLATSFGPDAAKFTAAGTDLARVDAVLVRTMPPGTLEQVVFRMDLLARLESAGKVVINPPRAVEAAVDKYLASARLAEAGLHTPRTVVCQTVEDALEAFERLGGDVVLKPLFGGEGRGITRLNDEALAQRAFSMLAQLGAVLYLQEFIPHDGADLRVLVVGERMWGIRRRNPLDWRTNVSRGATAEPLEVTDELAELSRRAVAAIGAPVAGVDLLPGKDGCLYAIEVNAVPGWQAVARTLQVDIAQEVLRYVQRCVWIARDGRAESNRGMDAINLMEQSSSCRMENVAEQRSAVLPKGINVARRLTTMATPMSNVVAVATPHRHKSGDRRAYRTITFRELEEDSNRIASGLVQIGVAPGMRLALLVRPSIEFISLVFGLFKAGAVIVLIDPGMGRRNLIRCLEESQPEGFVAVPMVHAVRFLLRRRFPRARFNVTVGRRMWWDGLTLDQLRARGQSAPCCHDTSADDPAAIIFTTGSTGPPKGVLYRHGNFDRQVSELGEFYGIQPGEIDLPGFPLFGLFNCALGVTTVIPEMDPSRPARVDPRKIVEAIEAWNVTQAFGSPAIWNRVGRYCQEHQIRLPTLRRVLSAGAPVPPHVLARMKECIAPEGDVHTPYGATESLPVASIAASEVLAETQYRWARGGGTCVGRKFPGIQWKVIRISDGAIPTLDDAMEEPRGAIGELIVSGPVVTREYVTRTESNALGKIVDAPRIWHRMGDVGYLDEQDRFWFCGRMAHRVATSRGVMFTIPCEAIFNQHPAIYRSALVGVGLPGEQRPVIIAEPWPGQMPSDAAGRERLVAELAELGAGNSLTVHIEDFLLHRAMPVDIRHNAKIFREQLAVWAAKKLR